MEKLSSKIITLHNQFSRYGRNAREWMRKCVLLLPEIERNRVWEKKGFCSIYEYAAKLAGMSRETVNEALRVLKKIEDKPELIRVVEEKGLFAVRPVVAIATKENADFWAKKALNLSKNTLETYVREYKTQSFTNDYSHRRNASLCPGEDVSLFKNQKRVVAMELESSVIDRLEKLKAQGGWNELIKKFLKLYEEKIAQLKKDSEEKFKEIEKNATMKRTENIYEQKNKSATTTKKIKPFSRHVPAKIKKYAIAKTNGTCAFPGCTRVAEILHHTDRFAIMRKHDPKKIVPLCKAHHNLIHTGLIEEKNYKILREPNMIDYKFFIDQQVATYRKIG